MPVDGQSRRTNTPLSRRDKRVLAAAAGIAAIATLALAAAYAIRPAAPSNTDCIVVNIPSTMGGARLLSGEAAAHAFCHSEGSHDRAIAAACRRQGYLADLHP